MAPFVLYRVCYGSSTPEPSQMNLLTVQPAILRQHKRHRLKGSDYPAVLQCEQSDASVRGTFVTGLTDEDLWRLDIFEGKEYERKQVRVQILDEEGAEMKEAHAETYIWIADEDLLEKREWDFEEFVREKMMLNWVDAEPGNAIRPSYRGNFLL